jgi:hypothetical protein
MPYGKNWSRSEVKNLRRMIKSGMTNDQIFSSLCGDNEASWQLYRGDNAVRQRIQIEKRKMNFTKRNHLTPPVPELIAIKRGPGRPRKTRSYDAKLNGLLRAISTTVDKYLRKHSI